MRQHEKRELRTAAMTATTIVAVSLATEGYLPFGWFPGEAWLAVAPVLALALWAGVALSDPSDESAEG